MSNRYRRGSRVAVVGGGISGIVAAHYLSREFDVCLIEANSYLGGHTNTIQYNDPIDGQLAIDTGFIVCNPTNYPNFYRFLDELNVPRRKSEMSFAFLSQKRNFCYLGPQFKLSLKKPANFLNLNFLRLLLDIRKFNKQAGRDLQGSVPDLTLGEYVKELKLSSFFIECYLVPLAASIWSSDENNILNFPMATFLRFFNNHGMLDFYKIPQWETIAGGSFAYVKAFIRQFKGKIFLNAPVVKLFRERGAAVRLILADGQQLPFDAVFLATHADQSLAMLASPTSEEQAALTSWRYSENKTTLHMDTGVLPVSKKLWASWNYLEPTSSKTEPVSITYYMNKLQGFKTSNDYFVTLNQEQKIDERNTIFKTAYTHPIYDNRSGKSQELIKQLNGSNNTFFCGAYLGYGFHEDGVVSALQAIRKLESVVYE